MSPIEGVGGTAEKVAPLIKFPVVMRVVFPGMFAALCLYPFTDDWEKILPAIPHIQSEWRPIIFAALSALALGAVVSALRNTTYKVFAGALFWPPWLFSGMRKLQQLHVLRMLRAARSAQEKQDTAREEALWRKLRVFPLNSQSDPHASRPTLLGNIIAAYEEYPLTRYGMDTVFYWPRIWLQLEKEKKEEIDSAWSRADGALSLSAIALAGGLSWLSVAVALLFGKHLPHPRVPLNSLSMSALAGFGLLVAGYLIYRFTLGFHIANAETFKSVFDLYRDKLSPMSVDPGEKERWRETWAYLQYQIILPKTQASPQLVPPSSSAPAQSKQVGSGQT